MRAFTLCLLACMAVSAYGIASYNTAAEKIKNRYLVALSDDIEVGDFADRLQKALNTRRFKLGKVLKVFRAVRALSLELSDEAVDFVRRFDGIVTVEEDGVVRAQAVSSWGLDRIDQRNLPMDNNYNSAYDGSNVNVYVVDTGIWATHNDFAGRATIFYDAVGGNGNDCNGHGTHCAGTVGGTEYGVAKNTNLFGVRVLNCLGSGSYSGIVDGMDYIATYGSKPAVVSMSLGGGASSLIDNAVRSLYTRGFFVSVAAGNSNDNSCNYSPARSGYAMTVGATDRSDSRASFSCYGSCVNIWAPGVDITSAWIRSDTATNTISGTSMACPHVSGVAALMLQASPSAAPGTIGNDLLSTATPGLVSDIGFLSPNLLLFTN
ncbi:aqualysin-1-like [Lytechinus variegatus]|uniref:aqualysin-1-like n=1 Tax=Lytechinus variegatus TaxID=7654 RepID=UPI001BB29B43|nr:aqualysin-1-like [Lytechinus variegatus]XP_041477737.1 aqualysin-1-like [Lytechinus variegatus]